MIASQIPNRRSQHPTVRCNGHNTSPVDTRLKTRNNWGGPRQERRGLALLHQFSLYTGTFQLRQAIYSWTGVATAFLALAPLFTLQHLSLLRCAAEKEEEEDKININKELRDASLRTRLFRRWTTCRSIRHPLCHSVCWTHRGLIVCTINVLEKRDNKYPSFVVTQSALSRLIWKQQQQQQKNTYIFENGNKRREWRPSGARCFFSHLESAETPPTARLFFFFLCLFQYTTAPFRFLFPTHSAGSSGHIVARLDCLAEALDLVRSWLLFVVVVVIYVPQQHSSENE